VSVEELADAGDRVVALVRYSGRGRESGIKISGANADAQVWSVRNHQAIRVERYGGTAEAREAVGLSEWCFGRKQRALHGKEVVAALSCAKGTGYPSAPGSRGLSWTIGIVLFAWAASLRYAA